MNTTPRTGSVTTAEHARLHRLNRYVKFAPTPTTHIHIIPKDQLDWQANERADEPSAYPKLNAEALALRSYEEAGILERLEGNGVQVLVSHLAFCSDKLEV
ncbi:hypothetical protein J1614_004386 [Plenodomus biglobosus]|nr:hypothetical protein J1614_004386 [Plenodomus biglobosus]